MVFLSLHGRLRLLVGKVAVVETAINVYVRASDDPTYWIIFQSSVRRQSIGCTLGIVFEAWGAESEILVLSLKQSPWVCNRSLKSPYL